MVEAYYDQRDARDALRESREYMQHEDWEFEQEVPRVTFKEWLSGYWEQLKE